MNSNSTRMTLLAGLLAMLALPCAAAPASPSSQPAATLPQVSPTVSAVHYMTQAADQLQRSDPGQTTQSLQADALEQLRRIMDALRKQQQQQSSKSPSGQQPSAADPTGSQQQNSQNGSGKNAQDKQASSGDQKNGNANHAQQPGSGQQATQGGSQAAGDSYLPGQQAPAGAAALPSELGKVEAWGFLPPDQRRQVLQGMQAEPPARYRKLTERYWRMLNESAGKQE